MDVKRTLFVIFAMLAVSLVPSAVYAVVVADSNADYVVNSQGANGWFYRYESTGGAGSGLLPYDFGWGGYSAWAFADSWRPFENATAMNVEYYASAMGRTWAVRRYVSEAAGPATIYGDIMDNDGAAGQEVHLDVKVNGILIGSKDSGLWPDTQSYSFATPLAIGDLVDFIIGKPNLTVGQNGSTVFHGYVDVIPEPATLALLAIGSALWLVSKRRGA